MIRQQTSKYYRNTSCKVSSPAKCNIVLHCTATEQQQQNINKTKQLAKGLFQIAMAEGVNPNGKNGDEGGGRNQEQQRKPVSYADRLKTNIRYVQRLKRNVLDIEIEKLDKDNDIMLDQVYLARLMTSIGINIKTQYQGYHATYGRGGATS